MIKVYLWTLIPWCLPKSGKQLSVAEPQKQSLATSGTKGNASIMENKATWHAYAQRRNISIQSHAKMGKRLLLTNRSTPIIHNTVNQSMISQSPIIIEDSANQITNRLNSAITLKNALLLSKKLKKKETRMNDTKKDTKRVINYPH